MTGILLCLVAILLLVGALYLILCHEPLVAAWWYRIFRDPEPYSSQFADAPEVGPGILRARPDPVDDVHDNYQRAQWFTGADEMLTAPAVVAGDDLMVAKLVGELQSLYAAYRRGEDVYGDARREPSPEAQR